jgi:hypothetical protein
MHARSLGTAFCFLAAMLFGTGVSFAQPPVEPTPTAKSAAKPVGTEKHKEHGKHEKADHEKKDGAKAGEAKGAR